MAQVWLRTHVVVFLSCLALTSACQWDPHAGLRQGLTVSSFDDGAAYLAYLPEISDPEQCQNACCERDECQLALIGTPADGRPECRLVSCMKDGMDVCVLVESTQFQVYRKIPQNADGEARSAAVNSTDYCRLPRTVGNCRASMPRFFYDVTDQTCKSFVYGGCGGNDNNFASQSDCEVSCSGVTGSVLSDTNSVSQQSRLSPPENKNDDEVKAVTEVISTEYQEKCLAAPQAGRCRASHRRFYYSNGACKLFVYGGCGGNKNNYVSEESCMEACSGKIIPSPFIPSTAGSVRNYHEKCTAPSDSGPCRAAMPMFYFEASSQTCKPFIYGGCLGNHNQYSSEQECLSTCSENGGLYDEHGNRRSRWTPAFFLVATLAIMSALLLVGLVLIFVRRNSNRSLMLDDKEELLSADVLH